MLFVWILPTLMYCFRVCKIHVSDELVDVLEPNLHALDTSYNHDWGMKRRYVN